MRLAIERRRREAAPLQKRPTAAARPAQPGAERAKPGQDDDEYRQGGEDKVGEEAARG